MSEAIVAILDALERNANDRHRVWSETETTYDRASQAEMERLSAEAHELLASLNHNHAMDRATALRVAETALGHLNVENEPAGRALRYALAILRRDSPVP